MKHWIFLASIAVVLCGGDKKKPETVQSDSVVKLMCAGDTPSCGGDKKTPKT